jgi:hypothetical protein
MFSKLVDVAYTDEEKAEKFPGMAEDSAPDYPWGLCLTLDECTLEKLGLEEENPEIGDMIDLRAFGKVTGIRKDMRDGEAHTCLEIQISHLAVEDEDDEEPGEDDDD